MASKVVKLRNSTENDCDHINSLLVEHLHEYGNDGSDMDLDFKYESSDEEH